MCITAIVVARTVASCECLQLPTLDIVQEVLRALLFAFVIVGVMHTPQLVELCRQLTFLLLICGAVQNIHM